jgi:hypothetical protein
VRSSGDSLALDQAAPLQIVERRCDVSDLDEIGELVGRQRRATDEG